MKRSKELSTKPQAVLAEVRPHEPLAQTAPIAPAASAGAPIRPSSALAAATVCLLLVLAVAVVFGGTLHFDFVNYDDDLLVSENPIVARGVTPHNLAWAFTANVANMWYPLTWISYMLDSQIHGMQPWGFHCTNVLLHAAASVILFLALRRATGSLWASALVTALFAIHPLCAESVAWIGERKSPLSGLFFASTIAAYLAFVRRPLSIVRYLLVAGLFTLGLLAKPTLVTLPFVLLLLDYWPLGRGLGARGWGLGARGDEMASVPDSPVPSPEPLAPSSALLLVLEKVPLFMLSIGCAVAAVMSQGGNIAPLKNVPITGRIANSLISYVVYLREFFWPFGLAAFYPRAESYPAWQVGGALVLLAAISLAAILAWRKQPALLVGWLWYLGMLLPTIGLVQIGSHARADRYTYLPQIGLGIAVVWSARGGLDWLCGGWRSLRWLCAAGGGLVVAGLMACAWQQASYWQNSERLWTHALACTSNNVIAHCNLGLVLAARGEVDQAIAQYHAVLEIEPNDAETRNNLGLALAGRGQFDEAIAQYLLALQTKPNFPLAHNNLGIALAGRGRVDQAMDQFRKAFEIKPDLASAHYNLGFALFGRGQVDEAISEYRKALEIAPDVVLNHYCLGVALASRGQVDEAIAQYRKVLQLAPDFVAAHINLGVALDSRGHIDEAIAQYRQVLKLEPDYAEAHNNLGLALAKQGQIDEALVHLRRALEIQPDYLEAHFNLGMVLAGQGSRDAAREQYQAALALAEARNDQPLAAAIRAQIRRMH